MSFGLSIGDLIAACQLAQDIYCGYFEPLRQVLGNFQNTLRKLEDELDFIKKDFRNGDEGLAVRLTDFQPTLDACRNLVEEIRRASNEHGMRQEISGESIREWRRRIVDCTLELEKMVKYHARVRDAVEYLNDQGIMEARSNASPDDKQSKNEVELVVHPEYNELDANRNNKKKNDRIVSTPNFAKEKSNIKERLDLYTGMMNPPDPLSFCVSTLALADIGCAHEGVYRDIIKHTSDLVAEIKDKLQKPVAGHLASDDKAWIYGKVQQAEVLLAKANRVIKGMDKVVPQKRFRWVFQKRGVAESYKGAICQCYVTLSQIRSSLIELQRQRYRESMSWEADTLPQSRQIANTLRQGDVRRSYATEHNRYLIETGVDTVSMFWEPSFGLSQVMAALHGLNISKIASPDHPAKTISYGWHQDLKPKNILTSEEEHGRWLISNFGLGRFYGYHKRSCSPPAKALTKSDAPYHGTKHQAPTCIPHSFDIWSLGCVLLEAGALLTTGSASALVINGYHGSLPSGNASPIWAEDENRSPIIQLLTKILSKSSMTENIPLPRFITAPTPGEFIAASLVYGLATTTFYYRQHQKRLDHSCSSSHEHYVLLAGIISPFALGHFLGLDIRGAVMQLMPWTILAALIVGATLHRLLSLAEQRGLRGKLGNAKVTDVESSLGMDNSAARVKGGI